MNATNRSFSNKESFFRGYILTPYWKINYFVSEHAKHHEKVMCLSSRPLILKITQHRPKRYQVFRVLFLALTSTPSLLWLQWIFLTLSAMPLKYALAATAASQQYLYQAPLAANQAFLAPAQLPVVPQQGYAMDMAEPAYADW